MCSSIYANNFSDTEFPATINMYPIMGFLASLLRKANSWRVWCFARVLDHEGSGVVPQTTLIRFMHCNGITNRCSNEWIKQAINDGLFVRLPYKSGPALLLTGLTRAAKLLGCYYLGERPASMPAQYLARRDWKAHVWTAFIATFDGKPIGRSTLREVTGVPERSQYRYEKKAGVNAQSNYCVSDLPAGDYLDLEREFGHNHAFEWFDPSRREKVVAWRLPDCRIAPKAYLSCPRGRTKKINKALRFASLLLVRGQNERAKRFFGSRQKALNKASKMLKRHPVESFEIYYKKRIGKGTTTWKRLAVVWYLKWPIFTGVIKEW